MSFPVLVALAQGAKGGEGTEQSAHDVVCRGADPERPPGWTGHVRKARHHLHHLVHRGAVLIGAVQETLAGDDDQGRELFAEPFGGDPHPGERFIAEVLHEHVCTGEQGVERLASRIALEIEGDGAFAPVEGRKERATHAGQMARLVPFRRLDLDHFGAEKAEEHAARWPHDHMAHLDDTNPGERHIGVRHRRCPPAAKLADHKPYRYYKVCKITFANCEIMDIRQLRYFAAVFEQGTLSSAAETVRIAPSALSLHLSNLEAELGVVLFVRKPRGMEPTAAGHRLYAHAKLILKAVAAAEADLREAGGEIAGTVAVGM